MTTPDVTPENKPEDIEIELGEATQTEQDEKRRRSLLLLLLLLLLGICCVGIFFVQYLVKPQPLPDMLPIVADINYPPTYKFSIVGLDKPVGVAASPDGQLAYVTESDGERLVKVFDRDGNLVNTFAPPGTSKSNRKLAYIAVDALGRVFVTDMYNNTIAIFDAEGNFLDGIIARDVTLTEVLSQHLGGAIPAGTLFYYNNISNTIDFQLPGESTQSIPGPDQTTWSPLGLRFDAAGNLMITNIVRGEHGVLVFDAASIGSLPGDFNPQVLAFGAEGPESGQFSFPNAVVADSLGNFYVSDGNNGRISQWDSSPQYTTFFGFGSNDQSLNLPRGMWMDSKDRLHVADSVGQYIRVYSVAGEEPAFLYNFGVFGDSDGQFNFPTDICIDSSGRLYIADRENNRVQIWSY